MRPPASPGTFFLFLFTLMLLFLIVQLQAISFVFSKLGLSPHGAALLLFGSLFGSLLNLPLFYIHTRDSQSQQALPPMTRYWQQRIRRGYTLLTVNTGGALIPVSFSIYLIYIHHLPITQILVAITVMSLISFLVSRPIEGLGIGMPILIAPIAAALTGLLINAEHAAPLAYIGGTLGVLIGADLLRLGNIRNMGVFVASIGGAGTFDGIFITGIIAVLLT